MCRSEDRKVIPALLAASGLPSLIEVPPRLDLAGGAHQAGERAQELALAVARDAGDADDLAALGGHVDVVKAIAGKLRYDELAARLADGAALGRKHVCDRPADDQPQHLLVQHLAIGAVPLTSPSRMTVTRSAICRTSWRRWEM